MTPCGRTRREFLWQTGAGFTGLALTAMLAEDGFFAKVRAGRGRQLGDPLAPEAAALPRQGQERHLPVHVRRPVSQVDTVRPQAELAAKNGKTIDIEIRKGTVAQGHAARLASEVRQARAERDRGLATCIPNLAGCVDDLAVIRSMYADSFAHGSALIQMNTGSLFQGKPVPGELGRPTAWGPRTGTCRASSCCSTTAAGRSAARPTGAPATCRRPTRGRSSARSGDPILNLAAPGARHPRGAAGPARPARRSSTRRTAPPGRTSPSCRPGSPATSWPSGCRPHAPEAVDLSQRDGRDADAVRPGRPGDRPTSAASACWPGGWSSAACGSCRSTPAAATTTRTGTPTATSNKNHDAALRRDRQADRRPARPT